MIDRDELLRYLDDYLTIQQGSDYCPNGLQVEGRPETIFRNARVAEGHDE